MRSDGIADARINKTALEAGIVNDHFDGLSAILRKEHSKSGIAHDWFEKIAAGRAYAERLRGSKDRLSALLRWYLDEYLSKH